MNLRIAKIVEGYDWVLVGSALLLTIIGLSSLFGTTAPTFTNFYKQLLWLVLGITALVIFSSMDYRIFRTHSLPVLVLYVLGVAGLVAVLFFGTTVRGARSWIDVGFFNIEPVEPLKVITVLLLAKYFSMRNVELYRFRHLLISGVYVAIPVSLVLLQPDMGSLSILLVIWGGMMIVAGIKAKNLVVLAAAGGVFSLFAWNVLLYNYQKVRILTFFDPASDPLGVGYNTIQSLIAVASGGLWGRGIGQGTQSQLGFLPEVQTDFIYAAIAEELGVLVALVVLALFVAIFWRLFVVARLAGNNFARLTIIGIAIMIAAQATLNIAVTLGLAPVAGVPLPFVSYGGSSLITLFIALGIIQSIYRHTARVYTTELRGSSME